MQLSEFLLSASKFWTQSADWWILIIHEVILVFISSRDKKVLDRPTQTPPYMWFCSCDACDISLQILALTSLFLVIFLYYRIQSVVFGRQF